MSRLKIKYEQEVIPILKKELEITNILALPKVTKIILNVGTGKHFRDSKQFDKIKKVLTTISGQLPLEIKTNKSIAQFKTRAGMVIALKVTLRGKRMYDFLDKLISISLPRTRDFQGIDPLKIDNEGNLNFGIPEHIIFPELSNDELDLPFGLQINLSIKNSNKVKTEFLMKQFGFPFKVNDKK